MNNEETCEVGLQTCGSFIMWFLQYFFFTHDLSIIEKLASVVETQYSFNLHCYPYSPTFLLYKYNQCSGECPTKGPTVVGLLSILAIL